MVRWLGPAVAAWPFLPRTLAYTSACTVWAFAIEAAIHAFHWLLRRLCLLPKEVDKPPTRSTLNLVLANLISWFFQSMVAGIVLALYNPTPKSWTVLSGPYDGIYYLPRMVIFQLCANFLWWVPHAAV